MNDCKVKICGLTRAQDCAAVNAALPDYAGFVFADSRRRIDIKTAAAFKELLDPRIKTVGVFVNEKIDVILDIHAAGIIDLVQLHGDEDDKYINNLKSRAGCPVIKSVSIGDAADAAAALEHLPAAPDFLLFDTLSSVRGGSGKIFDHCLLKDYHGPAFFLSGGLTSADVPDAVRLLRPYCVDVSSGVETDGKKDPAKIAQFVSAVRQMSAGREMAQMPFSAAHFAERLAEPE